MELDDTSSALALTPPPAPAPVAVVSPQFCAPHAVSLTVTKDMSFSGGDFTVTDDDANGAVVLQAKGTFLCVRSHRVLYDAAGRAILLTMQRKAKTAGYTNSDGDDSVPLSYVAWVG
ncbi:unnamed protein product [Miscanthus lutarioriparius]|uniref:Uncharacterized protein n=1 Tax=Miscanthus lutarioriparius TaxID=422564 RepID=A0A811NK26_9POAL|nr:unnamed protein product [Miscanthus lutarioriparius]